MKIRIKPSNLKKTRWYEYLIRFVFGGLVTAMTGIITNKYGPVIGGMFLAFPSIFPASVTLVQTHKARQEKQEGKDKELQQRLGRQAAGVTSYGAALGSFGLLAFGIVLWAFSTILTPWMVLLLALILWFVVAVLAWWLYRKIR